MTSPVPVALPPLVLLGAGGHAKVLLALLRAVDAEVLGVCDPVLAATAVQRWRGIDVLGGDEVLDHLDSTQVGLVNGVGQVVGSSRRQSMFMALSARGFRFPALVHPAAWVDPSAVLNEGVQVMAGAVVQPDSVIGLNSVINTGARVDHDCIIAGHVHVAPAAVLCGAVKIAEGAFVGAGATVIQGLSLGQGSIVAAGTTLVRDLPAGHVVKSAPAGVQLWR